MVNYKIRGFISKVQEHYCLRPIFVQPKSKTQQNSSVTTIISIILFMIIYDVIPHGFTYTQVHVPNPTNSIFQMPLQRVNPND